MTRSLLVASTLALAACGPTVSQDAQSARTTSEELQALVTAHTAQPPADCATELDTYATRASTMLDSLGGMCPGLDTCFMSLGRGDMADMGGTVQNLRDELAQHRAQGCSATSVSDELTRHRTAMLGFCQHLSDRSGTMLGMGGGRMMRDCR